jgi:hypothetical protein
VAGDAGWRSWGLADEATTAFATELGPWEIINSAPGAARPASGATVEAEHPLVKMIRPTAQAVPG